MRTARLLLVMALGLAMAGCGSGSGGAGTTTTSGEPVDQTVEIRMVDVAFKPDTVTVKAGTKVRFVFTNDGQLVHEAAFGDEAAQAAVESGKQPRDGPQVGINKTVSVVRTFSTPGNLLIGCHVAGHYAAGMKVRLTVQ